MNIVGDTSGFNTSQRKLLDKLSRLKNKGGSIVDAELAERVSSVAYELQRSIAILLNRQENIEYVCVGSKKIVYLPDFGRMRVDQNRLRRLRLVVAFESDWLDHRQLRELPYAVEIVASSSFSKTKKSDVQSGISEGVVPVMPSDLRTDLLKLRLDSLILLEGKNGATRQVAHAWLIPQGGGLGVQLTTRYFSDIFGLEESFSDFIVAVEQPLVERRKQTHDVKAGTAIIVGVYPTKFKEVQYSIEELKELCRTADLKVIDTVIQRMRSAKAQRTLLGIGKLEEVVLHALEVGADILVFDGELSPGQLRALTDATELKIIDRTLLILDIFAKRATSREGRLQVELAQLKYSLPRLFHKSSGLSRLTGGIGGRGPGETKLEISRRRVRDRITFLEGKVAELEKQRDLRRSRRKDRGVPAVAIVGYTNAGKSTLLNSLTKGEVLVEDKLFATLEPTSRRMRFPNDREVVFSDTVGFIRELPKELIGAFRATLEEVGESDLVLHVVDASQGDIKKHISVVENTLTELEYGDIPRILVLNKIDRLGDLERSSLVNSLNGIGVSALDRTGFSSLFESIINNLNQTFAGRDPGGVLEYRQTPETKTTKM